MGNFFAKRFPCPDGVATPVNRARRIFARVHWRRAVMVAKARQWLGGVFDMLEGGRKLRGAEDGAVKRRKRMFDEVLERKCCTRLVTLALPWLRRAI